MIRNRRAGSGVRFTRRYATTLRVEMSPPERSLYDGAVELVRRIYARGDPVTRVFLRTVQAELGSTPAAAWPTLAKLGPEADDLLLKCDRIPSSRKIEKLLDLAREFGDRMIVFTRFQATHEELVRALEGSGISTASIHGRMRFREKEENLERFRATARLLVCTDVGSEGRNLQFCNAVVNFDLPWNPMRIEQRIGRVSRVGQEREVYVFNLVAADTLEDRLLDLLHAKINMFELVIGEIDSILGQMEEERSFEDTLMDLWCRGTEEFGRGMDELARGILEAKRRYFQIRETEDAVFADALSSEQGGV
jgi:superfamily II DNA or RNA helicase